MELTSVVHVEAIVLQAGEHTLGLHDQVLKARGHTLVHGEPADLLDRLVLP